jgi:hypothetical protein
MQNDPVLNTYPEWIMTERGDHKPRPIVTWGKPRPWTVGRIFGWLHNLMTGGRRIL